MVRAKARIHGGGDGFSEGAWGWGRGEGGVLVWRDKNAFLVIVKNGLLPGRITGSGILSGKERKKIKKIK